MPDSRLDSAGDIKLRWYIRRDVPRILEIEQSRFGVPLTEDELKDRLSQWNVIGKVAEIDGRVVGFVLYALHPSHITLLDIGVDPEYRRRGVGSRFIRQLQGKLSALRHRKQRLTAGNNCGVMNPVLQAVAGTHASNHGNVKAEHAGTGQLHVSPQVGVRQLTPRECERLQGFPDDYTLIPYRGKPAADGPRYKAIGNSMAVNVMRWIGERIQTVDAITEHEREEVR